MIHSGNRYLSMSEMKDNATYIYSYLLARGWTINAICAVLGNMQSESTINPSIWESLNPNNVERGYGLVQWTPSTKYTNWCAQNELDPSLMDSNLQRILYEVDNKLQWGTASTGVKAPFSFKEFTQSTLSPYTLAMYFLVHYERPKDQNQTNRGTQANFWYEYLVGVPPIDTGDGYIPKKKEPSTSTSNQDGQAYLTTKDKVKVINTTKKSNKEYGTSYDNKLFRLYYPIYDVLQVKGDRIVIGIGKTVTTAINIKNLRKVV